MDLSELYRDVVETSPDGIWVIDLEGRTVYANPEIARMHRVSPDALPTLTVFDTLDEPGRVQFAAHLDDVRAGRVNKAEVEVQWVRSDGEVLWVTCRESVLHGENGQPRALLHRYADDTVRHALIDSLRASEAALGDQVAQNTLMHAVASAANEAASLGDVLLQARSLVLLHDDWERARAFVPAPDGSGRVEPFWPDGLAPEEAEDPWPAAELALAQQAHDERRAVWDDRKLTIAFPIVVGVTVHAVVAITSAPPLWRFDMIETMTERVAEQLARVVERELAQAELAAARDQAMAASRQKSDFLATMSHEIRTPLNGVIGLNDLLLRTDLTAEQRRLAAGVQMSSRALLGLINDILDFSKIEAGRLELERLDFEVRPLVEQVVGMLAESARDKGLELAVSCEPDVPAAVCGDPTRLAQVLTNLVSNAVKFTEHGAVVVRAGAAPEGDRLRLRVSVTDTGVGVQESRLEHLFDPFTQADSSTTRVYGGTGLGLAISREIVEAMDGTISHQPNPGGGSVFSFTVLVDPAGRDGTGELDGSRADEEARDRLAGLRALVVDDNETNRFVVREQLAWWGVEADSAASVDEALVALRGAAHDVVLLDLAMPERDGLALARAVRADPALTDLRLLLLTSVTGVGADEVRAAGVDEVLTKPVLSSVLRDVLLQLVGGGPSAPAPGAAPHAAPHPAPHAAPRVTQAPGDRSSAGRPRVLVVEDNPVNQLVATGLLSALGYDVETVDDGMAALEAVCARPPDAILMDVQMPRMDGYTATRQIRAHERGPRRPIIAMTAAAVEGERERCLEAGMDDYLTKPVDPARLAETLERWLSPGTPAAATTEPPRDRLDLGRLAELRELDEPGESSYVDRAIGNFLTRAPDDIARLTGAAEAGDTEQLRALAHRLAGSALNLGAVSSGQQARRVEEHLVDGEWDEALAALAVLGRELTADVEALRDYQRSHALGTR